MKVAVVMLTSGAMSGGAAKHLRRMIPLWKSTRDISDLRLFVPEGLKASVAHPNVAWPSRDALTGRKVLRRSLAEFDPDVVFIPTARWVDCGDVPTVTMVRNMEPLEVPFDGNRLSEKLRNIARREVARRACKKSDRVIAVSQHVRDFLLRNWDLPDEKVAVVYHGVEAPAAPRKPAKVMDGDFLFTAGSIRPARGLTDVIGALPNVPNLRLVIGGKVDPGTDHYKRKLDELAARLGVTDRIVWAGQLDESEMAWCFANAKVFVMTSRAEACPNTVLEAMSSGVVSVSGNNAPMPEFFRDAALYYEPENAASLADGIRRALSLSNEEKQAMKDAARARAAEFTWQRTAERTLEELRNAVRMK